MGIDNYVYMMVGFEIEPSEEEKYWRLEKKGFDVHSTGYEENHQQCVFGRVLEGFYERCNPDIFSSFSAEEIKDEIDFTRKLMEGVVDLTDKDLKLYFISGCSY